MSELLKPKDVGVGQRWRFVDPNSGRAEEASVWDVSVPWPDGARRVHLRENHAISWEATDVEMLSDPAWTFLSEPSWKRQVSQRSSWDEYFMRIAEVVASRATCDRKHVGAVIVRDKSILATGYNGSIRGLPHCDDDGHFIEDNHCVRTVHAEANAIVQAARNGVRIDGASIYVTAVPCWGCFRLIANAGLLRVVFGESYRLDEKVTDCASELGIELATV
jgi:dCMP deaminase